MTSPLRFFLVGGAVRDEMMGTTSKDRDFAVEAESFDGMVTALEAMGCKIHVTKPEFLTVRAKVTPDLAHKFGGVDLDFVMCRADGPSADGRRPDFVTPGTIFDDLARRDFTVNAIAVEVESGATVDPFGGADDIATGTLCFVGNAMDRIREDGLRVLRGFRFMVTKGLTPTPDTFDALVSTTAAEMLGCVSVERMRDEVDRMARHDARATTRLLAGVPDHTFDAIFRDGLRLSATMKA